MNWTIWKKTTLPLLLVAVALALWLLLGRQAPSDLNGQIDAPMAVPVEVVAIERGPMELRRTFSGALEAPAELLVAPKVGGRVERLIVNLADSVTRGQLVAELDNDEYVQELARAKAELAVAKAILAEAASDLQIAGRELTRMSRLRERGVVSEADLDTARATRLAREAQREVAKAGVMRAQAALETARIRLGYTLILADWSAGAAHRVVAERLVDEGQTVAAHTPLLRIIELDPLQAVIYVSERDYGRLQPGQAVELSSDSYPEQRFAGKIVRIAPMFREATRQARVEVTVANPDQRLKPGMFVRATVVLERVAEAVSVPEQAVTSRHDRTGVFLVSDDGRRVLWREVRTGIRDGDRVQLLTEGLSGQVVTLGQQLIDDGSFIVLPGSAPPQNEALPEEQKP
jgi:RND family efflux transporter MFP subunit